MRNFTEIVLCASVKTPLQSERYSPDNTGMHNTLDRWFRRLEPVTASQACEIILDCHAIMMLVFTIGMGRVYKSPCHHACERSPHAGRMVRWYGKLPRYRVRSTEEPRTVFHRLSAVSFSACFCLRSRCESFTLLG